MPSLRQGILEKNLFYIIPRTRARKFYVKKEYPPLIKHCKEPFFARWHCMTMNYGAVNYIARPYVHTRQSLTNMSTYFAFNSSFCILIP